jgi:Glycosyl transferases group 1
VAGVDFDVVAPGPWPDRPTALLVASDNPMNVTGLSDFLRFTWPEVRRRVANATLRVAGRVGRMVPRGSEGVEVLGLIEDLAACYAQARVVVNPATAGTGLKIKTLEAFSHLRPIVTWPNGLDGVPESLARLSPPAEDYLDFAERVASHLVAEKAPFDASTVAAIRSTLSPNVVYRDLEARLAQFFDGDSE